AFGSALALFLYPHTLTGALAARNRATIRRNLAALPVYTLMLGVLVLLGFKAVADGIEPIGGDRNTIMPLLFDQAFPSWSAGLAFAAIGVGALVDYPRPSCPSPRPTCSPATSTGCTCAPTPRRPTRPESARSHR